MSHKKLAESLEYLAGLLENLNFQFQSEASARAQQSRLLRRLREHLIGRGRDLDAPLVAVLVGASGVGKSTILNSLVGEFAPTSAKRPTTVTPVLVHHPDDELWLAGDRILGGFEKIRVDKDESQDTCHSENNHAIRVKMSTRLRPGIVLIDTPDTNSYIKENREIVNHLRDVADLWIFVTTAQRYAESQCLSILRDAAKRQVTVGVVLNRVGSGSLISSKQGLSDKLKEVGLVDTPIFTILEGELEHGLIPDTDINSLRNWLDSISSDALMRSALARQAFFGSLSEVLEASKQVAQSYCDEFDKSKIAHDGLVEFGSSLKDSCKKEWFNAEIFTGDALNRLIEYAKTAMGDNLAENHWARTKMKWRRALLDSKQQLQPVYDSMNHILGLAFETIASRISRETMKQLNQYAVPDSDSLPQTSGICKTESTTDKEINNDDSTGVCMQWEKKFSHELDKRKNLLLHSCNSTNERMLYLTALGKCFHPEETVLNDFFDYYLPAEIGEELILNLKTTMEDTLETQVTQTIDEALKLIPDTSNNPEKTKEISKFITELQEQWFK